MRNMVMIPEYEKCNWIDLNKVSAVQEPFEKKFPKGWFGSETKWVVMFVLDGIALTMSFYLKERAEQVVSILSGEGE